MSDLSSYTDAELIAEIERRQINAEIARRAQPFYCDVQIRAHLDQCAAWAFYGLRDRHYRHHLYAAIGWASR